MEFKHQVLNIVKVLLNINDTSKDALLNIIIDEVYQRCLSYTNILELPISLVNCVSRLVVELYNKTVTGIESGVVQSISESGRTVSFATDVQKQADAIDFNAMIELRSVRRVAF